MATRVQAILARDVSNLGHVGEVVKVAPGYLRNFLLPKRLALPVSKSRLEHFEHQKKLVEHQLAKLKKTSEDIRDRIEVQTFTIEVKAGEQDKLFGSVGARDIEAAINEHGYNVHHRDIKLADGPLKSVGMHEIAVRLEGGVMAKVKVVLAKIEEPVEAASDEEIDASASDENVEASGEESASEEASEVEDK